MFENTINYRGLKEETLVSKIECNDYLGVLREDKTLSPFIACKRYRNKDNTIVGYQILDQRNAVFNPGAKVTNHHKVGEYNTIEIGKLKQLIRENKIRVENLTLTKDNRLIVKDLPWDKLNKLYDRKHDREINEVIDQLEKKYGRFINPAAPQEWREELREQGTNIVGVAIWYVRDRGRKITTDNVMRYITDGSVLGEHWLTEQNRDKLMVYFLIKDLNEEFGSEDEVKNNQKVLKEVVVEHYKKVKAERKGHVRFKDINMYIIYDEFEKALMPESKTIDKDEANITKLLNKVNEKYRAAFKDNITEYNKKNFIEGVYGDYKVEGWLNELTLKHLLELFVNTPGYIKEDFRKAFIIRDTIQEFNEKYKEDSVIKDKQGEIKDLVAVEYIKAENEGDIYVGMIDTSVIYERLKHWLELKRNIENEISSDFNTLYDDFKENYINNYVDIKELHENGGLEDMLWELHSDTVNNGNLISLEYILDFAKDIIIMNYINQLEDRLMESGKPEIEDGTLYLDTSKLEGYCHKYAKDNKGRNPRIYVELPTNNEALKAAIVKSKEAGEVNIKEFIRAQISFGKTEYEILEDLIEEYRHEYIVRLGMNYDGYLEELANEIYAQITDDEGEQIMSLERFMSIRHHENDDEPMTMQNFLLIQNVYDNILEEKYGDQITFDKEKFRKYKELGAIKYFNLDRLTPRELKDPEELSEIMAKQYEI